VIAGEPNNESSTDIAGISGSAQACANELARASEDQSTRVLLAFQESEPPQRITSEVRMNR
jgi:hypothetical protein